MLNLLLGRYHRPVAEERIFMFLDLNDSTAIAAALGPFRFNDFKNDSSSTTSPSPFWRPAARSINTSETKRW